MALATNIRLGVTEIDNWLAYCAKYSSFRHFCPCLTLEREVNTL